MVLKPIPMVLKSICLLSLLAVASAQYYGPPVAAGPTTTTSSGSASSSSTVSSSGGSSSSAVATSAAFRQFPGQDRNAVIAHVTCGALATMFFLPCGILIPRWARAFNTNRWWFLVHSSMNGIIAFSLIIAAFAIAKAQSNFIGGITTTHRKLGEALFIVVIIQVALGIMTHWVKLPKIAAQRGPSHFAHVILGLATVALGWTTVWYGMDQEWGTLSGTGNPSSGYKVAWGIIVGVVSAAYLTGIAFLPRQLKMEKQASNKQVSRFEDSIEVPMRQTVA